jgi:ferredoxin
MATFKTGQAEREIPDGTRLEPVAEAMGVSFGCHNGVCGACTVIVLEGMENLGPPNEAEEDMDLDPDQRLMCQCTISGGTVVIEQ